MYYPFFFARYNTRIKPEIHADILWLFPERRAAPEKNVRCFIHHHICALEETTIKTEKVNLISSHWFVSHGMNKTVDLFIYFSALLFTILLSFTFKLKHPTKLHKLDFQPKTDRTDIDISVYLSVFSLCCLYNQTNLRSSSSLRVCSFCCVRPHLLFLVFRSLYNLSWVPLLLLQ